jgi:hypothetical protein
LVRVDPDANKARGIVWPTLGVRRGGGPPA